MGMNESSQGRATLIRNDLAVRESEVTEDEMEDVW